MCYGRIRHNGSDKCIYRKSADGDANLGCSILIMLNIGDKVQVRHSSGTADGIWAGDYSTFKGKY